MALKVPIVAGLMLYVWFQKCPALCNAGSRALVGPVSWELAVTGARQMHNRITAVAGTENNWDSQSYFVEVNVRTCAILSEFFRYEVKQGLHDKATFCLEQGKVATDGVDELVCDYVVDSVSGEFFKLILPKRAKWNDCIAYQREG